MVIIIRYSERDLHRISREIADIILDGKIVAIPTDTCYGLAADATNEAAVRKLFRIKRRPHSRPVAVFLGDPEDSEEYAVITPLARALLRLLPERLTIILRAKEHTDLVKELVIKDGKLGIRVPPFLLPRLIAKKANVPITATSANLYGLPPIYSSEKLRALEGIDCIVDIGDLPKVPVSTVIDASSGKLRVLRVGAISLEKLASMLSKILPDYHDLIVTE